MPQAHSKGATTILHAPERAERAKLATTHQCRGSGGAPGETVQATEQKLSKVIRAESRYTTPIWQRRYAWGPEQWRVLWEDLLDINSGISSGVNESSHFFGSFILAEQQDSAKHPGEPTDYDVIDGQQRLMTSYILLAAIRDVLGSKSTINFVSYLKNIDCRKGLPYRLIPQEADIEMFHLIMEGQPEKLNELGLGDDETSEGVDEAQVLADDVGEAEDPYYKYLIDRPPTELVTKAYHYFRREIEARRDAGYDLVSLVSTLENFDVVSITLQEGDSRQKIFETVNALGVDLDDADLIRNYIFMRLPVINHVELYKAHWKVMEERLGTSLKDFLLSYVVMKGVSTNAQNKGIYRGYRYHLTRPDDSARVIQKLLADLEKKSKVFSRALPSKERDCWGSDVESRLQFLSEWGATPMHPLLLLLMVRISDEKLLNQAIWMLQSFLVRRYLKGVPPNDLRSRLNKVTLKLSKIEQAELLSDLYHELNSPLALWPSDEDLERTLPNNPVFTDARAKWAFLTLKALAPWFEAGSKALPGDVQQGRNVGTYQVEHVMPRNSVKWRDDLEKWGVRDVTQHCTDFVNVLPNLVLTKFNQNVLDDPFSSKCAYLGEDNIAMTREVGKRDTWGSADLAWRAEQLLKALSKQLPGPTHNWLA